MQLLRTRGCALETSMRSFVARNILCALQKTNEDFSNVHECEMREKHSNQVPLCIVQTIAWHGPRGARKSKNDRGRETRQEKRGE